MACLLFRPCHVQGVPKRLNCALIFYLFLEEKYEMKCKLQNFVNVIDNPPNYFYTVPQDKIRQLAFFFLLLQQNYRKKLHPVTLKLT